MLNTHHLHNSKSLYSDFTTSKNKTEIFFPDINVFVQFPLTKLMVLFYYLFLCFIGNILV